MSGRKPLVIEVQTIGDALVVSPTGLLEVATAPQLRDQLLKCMADQPRAVIVKLQNLVLATACTTLTPPAATSSAPTGVPTAAQAAQAGAMDPVRAAMAAAGGAAPQPLETVVADHAGQAHGRLGRHVGEERRLRRREVEVPHAVVIGQLGKSARFGQQVVEEIDDGVDAPEGEGQPQSLPEPLDVDHVDRRQGPVIAVEVVVEELGQVIRPGEHVLPGLDVEGVDEVDGGDDRQVGIGVEVHWLPPLGCWPVRPMLRPYPFRRSEATVNIQLA